jgi:hypothetical protein
MNTHKPVVAADISLDDRYNPVLDGRSPRGTPYIALPLKGRSGSVIGVIAVVRGANSSPFTHEDIIAGELVAGMGSLVLYWCLGMSTLHSKISSGELEQLKND